MIHINTLMIQQVLAEPDWRERLTVEDLRALTPLVYANVNPYGIIRLDMAQRLPIDDAAGVPLRFVTGTITRSGGGEGAAARDGSGRDAVGQAGAAAWVPGQG